MSTLVLKFGGASVASVDSFARLVEIIEVRRQDAKRIVVVVSAMGGMTDHLISMAKQVHPHPPQREYDMLVTVGERISMSLLSMALHRVNIPAISFTGSQCGILTDHHHSNARILDVKPWRLLPSLEKGEVIIVAGFQGVSQQREITTLGRGGSDTTAVALGAALGAQRVEFYKDVPGIFFEDPKKRPDSQHFSKLSFDEALGIVDKGAKVLHSRSLRLAKANALPLWVTSFDPEVDFLKRGTLIQALKTCPGQPRAVFEDFRDEFEPGCVANDLVGPGGL